MDKVTLPPARPLAQSRVLIVGGTSGVGLEAARQLLDRDVPQIVLVGRNAERGAGALSRLDAAGRVTFIAGDSGVPAETVRIARAAAEAMGGVDVLINSTVPDILPALFHTVPAEAILQMLQQLALPPMLMCSAVLPLMREQRSGVIVNIASDAGKSATPGESVIGSAMAAIIMFSRTLAMEAKRDGVRVNVLTPSLIHGTATGERVLKEGFSAKLFAKAASMASLGVAEASDLASLIVYLASPAARRLTGQAISLNGGISAA
jgi:NAD(P)-dependent dehydrogenase (short-subunit alcohol dehydrogenase family)